MSQWRRWDKLTALQLIDLPPIWLAGFLALTWGMVRILPALALPVPGLSLFGLALGLAGVGLMIWAIAAFRRYNTTVIPHQTPRHIIQSGPFAFSRNPIYLGDLMVLAGAVLWWGIWPALILVPLLGLILKRRFIAPEERRMKESFGAKFDAFTKKTRRWL